MKIAIVGSRKLIGNQLTRRIVECIFLLYPMDILVSGGADGVDSFAESFADLKGIPTEIYEPENERWKPEGYQERNIKIGNACDILFSITTSKSNTFGSGWTANYTEDFLKKEVHRIVID